MLLKDSGSTKRHSPADMPYNMVCGALLNVVRRSEMQPLQMRFPRWELKERMSTRAGSLTKAWNHNELFNVNNCNRDNCATQVTQRVAIAFAGRTRSFWFLKEST